MFTPLASTLGCCGYRKAWRPIRSLSGWVDSQEEAEQFLNLSAAQAAMCVDLHKEYPPCFWTFKLPDQERWFVTYTVSHTSPEEHIYSNWRDLIHSLEYNKSYEQWEIKKSYKTPQPLDIYTKVEMPSPVPTLCVVSGFSFNGVRNFQNEFDRAKLNPLVTPVRPDSVYVTVMHDFQHQRPQEMLTFLRDKFTILYESESWHNPNYPMLEDSDNDIHWLKTFFFQEKQK